MEEKEEEMMVNNLKYPQALILDASREEGGTLPQRASHAHNRRDETRDTCRFWPLTRTSCTGSTRGVAHLGVLTRRGSKDTGTTHYYHANNTLFYHYFAIYASINLCGDPPK